MRNPAAEPATERGEPTSSFPDGVELGRLIARAQLTPAQAVELGASVTAAAVRRLRTANRNPTADPVLLGAVLIGADGRVVADGPAGCATHSGWSAPGAVGATVESVLAELAGVVRPRARLAGPAAERLLGELDRAAADVPIAGPAAADARLREAAAAIDREAVRSELAALVRAIGPGTATPGGARIPLPWAAPEDDSVAGHTGSGPARGRRRRRAGAWLLSVLVLGVVVLLEVVLLRGRIAADVALLLDAGRSGSASTVSAAPTAAGPPVAAPAPASAGRVAGVDLRPLSPCAPGAPCTVRLEVRLVPRAAPQAVTWAYRVTDRCTGAVTTAPGGSVTVSGGATRADVVGSVPLPAGEAVALDARTEAPAAAASPPILVGSCPVRP